MDKIKTKKYLLPEDLSGYVKSLKYYCQKNVVDQDLKKVIDSMPSPRYIEKNFNKAECEVLYESVGWAWRKITGQDILEERNKLIVEENMKGNFWSLGNGVYLFGENHFTIIKRNIDLFATLLEIDPFTLHEELGRPPNYLLSTVINAGGVRCYINSNNNGYFQMIGKKSAQKHINLIKDLKLKNINIKLIDPTVKYKGWDSGISIRIK